MHGASELPGEQRAGSKERRRYGPGHNGEVEPTGMTRVLVYTHFWPISKCIGALPQIPPFGIESVTESVKTLKARSLVI